MMDLSGGNEGNYFCQHFALMTFYSSGFWHEYTLSCADLFLSE